MSCFQDGMYLIRKSTRTAEQPYTLQIYYRGQDFNLPVNKKDGQYSVGNNTKVSHGHWSFHIFTSEQICKSLSFYHLRKLFNDPKKAEFTEHCIKFNFRKLQFYYARLQREVVVHWLTYSGLSVGC